MPINEPVASYAVSIVKNDVVNFHYRIDLTLTSGGKVDILFPVVPPDDFLSFNGAQVTVFMAETEYTRVYHMLQTEDPVFFTALSLVGLPTVRLGTGPEPLGEGYGDAGFTSPLQSSAREGSASGPAKVS